jgi:hypothetical protein
MPSALQAPRASWSVSLPDGSSAGGLGLPLRSLSPAPPRSPLANIALSGEATAWPPRAPTAGSDASFASPLSSPPTGLTEVQSGALLSPQRSTADLLPLTAAAASLADFSRLPSGAAYRPDLSPLHEGFELPPVGQTQTTRLQHPPSMSIDSVTVALPTPSTTPRPAVPAASSPAQHGSDEADDPFLDSSSDRSADQKDGGAQPSSSGAGGEKAGSGLSAGAGRTMQLLPSFAGSATFRLPSRIASIESNALTPSGSVAHGAPASLPAAAASAASVSHTMLRESSDPFLGMSTEFDGQSSLGLAARDAPLVTGAYGPRPTEHLGDDVGPEHGEIGSVTAAAVAPRRRSTAGSRSAASDSASEVEEGEPDGSDSSDPFLGE